VAPTTAPATAPAPSRAAAAPVAAPSAEPSERQPTTTPGFDPRGGARKRPEPGTTAPAEKQPRQQTQIWTYVGVGFAFGLLLLGIYQLYGLLAH
jgi:hypothetical protein